MRTLVVLSLVLSLFVKPTFAAPPDPKNPNPVPGPVVPGPVVPGPGPVADPGGPIVPLTPANPADPAAPAGAPKKGFWAANCKLILAGLGGLGVASYYFQDVMNDLRGKADLKKEHEDAITDTRDGTKELQKSVDDLRQEIRDSLKQTPPSGDAVPVTMKDGPPKKVDPPQKGDPKPVVVPKAILESTNAKILAIGEPLTSTWSKEFNVRLQAQFETILKDPRAKGEAGEDFVLLSLGTWIDSEIEAKRLRKLVEDGAGRKN